MFLMQWVVRNMTHEFAALRREHHTLQTMVMEDFRLLIMHDAQIRGVNPTSGKDMTESHQKALEVYHRVLSQLDTIEKTVAKQAKDV